MMGKLPACPPGTDRARYPFHYQWVTIPSCYLEPEIRGQQRKSVERGDASGVGGAHDSLGPQEKYKRMATISIDTAKDDEARRARIYAGEILVRPPTPLSLEYCAFARTMLDAAFAPLEPQSAQYHMPVQQYAQVLAELKPRFIHHPESKRFIRAILGELGCDAQDTYFDVPRLRSSTSDAYLTTGIAYAFHPHRDTWYSAPLCQINWWMPVYEIEASNAMAFHPRYWRTGVPNSSANYDYQRWNATSRFNAAQHVGTDTREQPKALIPIEAEPDLRVLPPVGGLIIFSGAQLHSSVPNTSGRTRFSIDFRTVNVADARVLRGAPNRDSRCTGTAMPDYLRLSDLSHVPEDIQARYMAGHPQAAEVSDDPAPQTLLTQTA